MLDDRQKHQKRSIVYRRLTRQGTMPETTYTVSRELMNYGGDDGGALLCAGLLQRGPTVYVEWHNGNF